MDDFIAIARKTANVIERRIKQESHMKYGKEVAMGADGTPTLYIDRIAEEVAFEIIGQSANILSEEAGFIDNDKEYTFVIDPVDGTRNAAHGIPFYCTSIAIGRDDLDSIEYGIVVNLISGERYEAFKGKGAFLNGQPISVSTNRSDVIYVLVLGKSGNERTWHLANSHNIRSLGAAALEMCMVACGAAQIYYMPKELLRVTDFAASTLIVREAGGKVYTASGDNLRIAINLRERSSILAVADDSFLGGLL